MVFLVAQIRCRAKVLKTWYGCVINDSNTISDVYSEFSGGELDGGLPISEEYLGGDVTASVGRTKTDLTRVSSQCPVGDAVSALGQYIEYNYGDQGH